MKCVLLSRHNKQVIQIHLISINTPRICAIRCQRKTSETPSAHSTRLIRRISLWVYFDHFPKCFGSCSLIPQTLQGNHRHPSNIQLLFCHVWAQLYISNKKDSINTQDLFLENTIKHNSRNFYIIRFIWLSDQLHTWSFYILDCITKIIVSYCFSIIKCIKVIM